MRWQHPRIRDEHGVASVIALGLLAILLLAAMSSAGVVSIVVLHRRAQAAADLAALAAGQALQRGDEPCAAGAVIAAAQDARVSNCSVEGSEVVVETAMTRPGWLGGSAVSARARAGPEGGS